MAILSAAAFAPLPTAPFAPGFRARVGTGPSSPGERQLAQNVNHILGQYTAPLLSCLFTSDAGYLQSASGTPTVRAQWKLPVPADSTTAHVALQVENTGAAPVNVTLQWAVNTSLYHCNISVPATAGLQDVSGTLDLPPVAVDVLELVVANPTDGHIRVYSVSGWASPRSSFLTGPLPSGAIPIDDAETAADGPLSTHLRQAELDGLLTCYCQRVAPVVTYAEDLGVRGPGTYAGLRSASGDYIMVAQVPVTGLHGLRALTGAVAGKRLGSYGAVRLRTGYMISQGTEVYLTFDASVTWQEVPAMPVLPGADDFVEVTLRGDGALAAVIYGLNLWPVELTP